MQVLKTPPKNIQNLVFYTIISIFCAKLRFFLKFLNCYFSRFDPKNELVWPQKCEKQLSRRENLSSVHFDSHLTCKMYVSDFF